MRRTKVNNEIFTGEARITDKINGADPTVVDSMLKTIGEQCLKTIEHKFFRNRRFKKLMKKYKKFTFTFKFK